MGEDWIRDPHSACRIDERTRRSTAASQSSEPAPRILEYEEYRADERLTCPRCAWSGQAGDASIGYHEELFDVSCPCCEKMLLVVSALVDIGRAGVEDREGTCRPRGTHGRSAVGHSVWPGASGREEPVQEPRRGAE